MHPENSGTAHTAPGTADWLSRSGSKAGFLIGIVTLLFFMGLVGASLFGKTIPCNSRFVTVVVMTLGISLSAGFIGGSAKAEGRLPIPLMSEAPVKFAVQGGIAAFLIIMIFGWFLYARDCPDLITPGAEVTVGLPRGSTFQQAIAALKQTTRATVAIKNCPPQLLSAKVDADMIAGKDISDWLSQLRLRMPDVETFYRVETIKQGERYNVVCQ